MSLLDNRSLIKQIDPNNYLSHILDAPEQIIEGYRLGSETTIPALYAQSKQVVFLATGEMLPVAQCLLGLMIPYARVPAVIVDDYVLPHWVSSDTLVIALDYGGISEQVLAGYYEAAQRKARLLALSLGGPLAKASRRYKAQHITLSYGSPARVAFYYVFSCAAELLKKLDFIELRNTTVDESSVLCRSLLENIAPEMAQYRNSAKQLAEKVVARKTVIVGSGPLVGIAKKWQIAFAATGKVVAVASTLSEFNDTIINGLEYQAKATDAPLVIMLQSKYDHMRNKVQQTLTYQVAQAQKFIYEQVFMHPSGSSFGEIVLAGLLGDMVSYYVAWLLNRDPSALEITLFIKENLSREAYME